jgi:hypothetical protein
MSFENIQLPSSVLSGLYKQVVVTDDYQQMPGSPARRLEETVPATADAGSAATEQSLNAGSGTASSTQSDIPVQEVAGSNPVFPTTNVPTESQPVSGWSTTPSLPTAPPASAEAYRFLGKNARHVAIIVHSPADAYLPDDQLQLLTKMLDACKLNLGDVAIINQASQAVHFTQLADQLHSEKTLLFGVQPEQIGLPLSFPTYKEQEYAGCTYLLANPLGDMNQPNEEGKALKGKLWGCLKKMFNI